jgi:hypothetical protein
MEIGSGPAVNRIHPNTQAIPLTQSSPATPAKRANLPAARRQNSAV